MKYAVVGSRDYPKLDGIHRWISMLDPYASVILTGGARGVDAAAESAAKRFSIPLRVIPADWERYGRRAGVIRNGILVDQADIVVAFWDGKSRGTKNAIEHARHMLKPLVVVFP